VVEVQVGLRIVGKASEGIDGAGGQGGGAAAFASATGVSSWPLASFAKQANRRNLRPTASNWIIRALTIALVYDAPAITYMISVCSGGSTYQQ
jgi:hypothetical protein